MKRICSLVCLLLGMVIMTYAQRRGQPNENVHPVAGTVKDTSGEPLIGVNIYVEGNQNLFAITDVEGKYVIQNVSPSSSLHFSYVGMKEQLIKVGNQVVINVTLTDDQELEEVVVTGYQVLSKRLTTAAVTSVKMDDILSPDMTTVDQALEGRIPDLVFTANSGEAGATGRVRVRGTSTLVGNREPIWVLDGFVLQDPVDVSNDQLNDPDYINYIGNAITGINPEDIDRVDVLKDAAATALYGTKASNGVIVVTTKRGQIGAPSVTYSNRTKVAERPRYTDSNINLMNSQERVQFGKDLCDMHYVFPSHMPMVGYEGAYYRYQTGQSTYTQFLSEVQDYELVNTDWFDILCHDAVTQNHTLSISGGNEQNRYYTSVGYTREDDVIMTQYTERFTTAMNLTMNLAKGLKADFRVNGNMQKKNHLPSELGVMNYAYETSRAIPCYNADGSRWHYDRHGYSIGDGSKSNNLYGFNILDEIDNSSSDYSGNTMGTNLSLAYNIGHILDITAAGSYTRSSTLQGTWFGEASHYCSILRNANNGELPPTGDSGYCELPYGGVYNTTSTISESMIGRIQANLHWAFGSDDDAKKRDKHLITSTMGYEMSMGRNTGIADNTRGYFKNRGMQYMTMDSETLELYPLYENWLAAGHRTLTKGKRNEISGYLTAAYDYANLFTLAASGRFDASNKFGSRANERFLPVWSLSAKWNIHETFFPRSELVNEWNVRLSHGKTGNMLDGETPDLLVRMGTLDAWYGEYVSHVSSLPNPNLVWEQTTQENLGMNISLFNYRLSFSTDVWYKYTRDAFASINVSTVNGIGSYQMNNGDIENKGWSFTLSGYPIKGKDWRWNLQAVSSFAANMVKTDTNDSFNLNDYLNGTAIVNGKPIGTFYAYEYLGLNPANGTPMFDDYADRAHLLEGKTMEEAVLTVLKEAGDREPKLTGSLGSTLTWKRLSLNVHANYRIGSKVRLFNLYRPIINGVASDKNVRHEFNHRWSKPGDELYTDIPVLMSPSDPEYSTYYGPHWSGSQSSNIGKVPRFADRIWDMYDLSDLRVVDGSYIKLSSMTLNYMFTKNQLKRTPFKSCRLGVTATNLLTFCSKELGGQDPSQPGFAGVNLSFRPSYTASINFTL